MVNLWLPCLQEPWFLVLFVWLIFVREHGNSERLLYVLLMVKLLQILKRVYINSHKSSRYVLAVKITNRRSRREGFISTDDCMDGTKVVRTSSSARAPLMEILVHSRKNTIFSYHLKNRLQLSDTTSHLNSSLFLWLCLSVQNALL